MIDAPHTGTSVQVQAVSSAGPVVAIRQVLPGGASEGSTVMGNVTVPGQYAGTIANAAASNGIPAALLAALVSHESGFDPTAVSSAGAEGIAQFMPATAAGMGINPDDPTEAINAAAKLLGSYTTKFGSYADALAAYDAGSSAVERYGGIPPYAETQAYVPAVLSMAGLSGDGGNPRMSGAQRNRLCRPSRSPPPSPRRTRPSRRPRPQGTPGPVQSFTEVLSAQRAESGHEQGERHDADEKKGSFAWSEGGVRPLRGLRRLPTSRSTGLPRPPEVSG